QLRAHRRLMLEDVEPAAGELAVHQHAGERVLVDDLAARRVDDDAMQAEQLETTRREQVKCCRRVRAVDRDDVDPRQHLVEALPICGFELLRRLLLDAAPVVIVDREAEAAGAPRHRLTDAAHADDAEALAPEAMAEHEGRPPAGPLALADEPLALGEPARAGE